IRHAPLHVKLAATAAVAFVIIYQHAYRHIQPTPESRHLIGFTAIIALVLLEELARRVWIDIIPREAHRVFVAATVTGASIFLWQRLYMLLRYQVIPRKKRRRAAKNLRKDPPVHLG